jgi:hypothetical protein
MKRAGLIVALAACTDHGGSVATGTQSLKIDLVSPADPGDPNNRRPGTPAPMITVNVTALDADGNLDPTFDRDVYAYAQFLGTLTPALGSNPLATFKVTAGKAMNVTVQLPPVFGPTTLWIDDGKNTDPTYATGTSPTIWFNDPFIKDIQTPSNPMSIDALGESPLDGKNVGVSKSQYGARGRLVITSVFAQGYTVADVQCADAMGNPPCVAGPYDHLEVFTFSAARDQEGRFIQEGQVIDGFAGGISEFNGLTEIGFPQSFVNDAPDVNPAREPTPVKVDPATWFNGLSDPNGEINFEKNEAGPIEIDNGIVCPLDADYATYKQWKLEPTGMGGSACGGHNVINIITAGVIAEFDPATVVGKTLPKVVGILRPVNIINNGTFNVWIIYPRSLADLTLQ